MKPAPQPALVSPNRLVSQDLARGLMLLLIVISNTQFFLWGAEHGPSGWHPVDGSAIDRLVQFLMIALLDMRVFPLFAFLFGYGMMQVYLRCTTGGMTESKAVAVLRRRSLWLILFGAVHASLLMAGDILGAYGLMSLVLAALLLKRSGRTQLIAAAVALLLLAALTALAVVQFLAGAAPPVMEPTVIHYGSGESSWIASVPIRLGTWLGVTIFGGLLGFAFHVAMLCGFWAARQRILERPEHHHPLLVRTAIVGITIGTLGGLPVALAHVGLIDVAPALQGTYGVFFYLQNLTGVAGGLGYAAALVLLVERLPERILRARPTVAIAASGKRALSSYLAHSVVFAPLLAAWGLGWGQHFGSAQMVVFAVLVWGVVVLAAFGLERRGHPGPAEITLRRLAYRRSPLASSAKTTG